MLVELVTIDQGENKGTMSVVFVDNTACSWILELPWLDNEPYISCIPSGEYPLVLEYSPKFNQKLYEVKDVPGRSECKFHVANELSELSGCLAPGTIPGKKDNGQYRVWNSTQAFNHFMNMMKRVKEAKLIISGRPSLGNYY